MTLEQSSSWFRLVADQQAAYLDAGRRRLAELNLQIGTDPATEYKQLLKRSRAGEPLKDWQLRRIEYLARKVEGDVNTGRKSEPAVGELRGGVSPAAGRGSVLVKSSRRQEAREMATPARLEGE